MNWLLNPEVPFWAALVSGATVVLARFAGIHAAWLRLRTFGDPALLGFRRRRLRESLLTILLGCAFTLGVATLLPDAAQRARSAGVTVLIFDAEGWRARQRPFDDRYSLAELMVARVSELLAGDVSSPVAALIHGAAGEIGVAPTRDLPGLLQRARALMVVQTTAAAPAADSNLAAAVRRARTRAGTRSRICVVTPRPLAEVSGNLAAEHDTGDILVAGVPDTGGEPGYRCLAGDESGYRQVDADEFARLLRAPVVDPGAETRPPLRRPQVLAALAFVLLLAEWILRTSGRTPRPSHVG